jgi:nucleoside-diphosphate-sugar epimerase
VSPARQIAVSGASGFLGSALCRHLAAHGFAVRALARDPSRRPAGLETLPWYRCELPEPIDESGFDSVEVFIHCAYETRFRNAQAASHINLECSERVFGIARARGVQRIIFVSSMSAHAQALSSYGRTKLAVEGLLDPARDLVVRPGHIVGEGGVYWRTAASIAALPFIPLFSRGEEPVQTIHVDDVCEGIRRAIELDCTGTLLLAEPDPVTLREFYAETARGLGKPPRFLRVPGGLALALLRAAEALGFSLPLSSDNLLGLRRLRAFDVAGDLRRIGLRPRNMRESLAEIRWNGLARK